MLDHNPVDIENREKGQFPISIATSLALEGAYGILEDQPPPPAPPINAYKELWINIRTLIRNIRGAMTTELAERMLPVHYVQALQAEMAIIDGIVESRSKGKIKIVFYVCDFNDIHLRYPHLILRQINTNIQKMNAEIENRSISLLLKTPSHMGHDIRLFRTHLHTDGMLKTKALIITHLPIDLLSADYFHELDLLESHTGVIKKPVNWNSKLYKGKELERIPFNRMSLQLFGDSGSMIQPYPIGYRKAIVQIAKENQWNATTTPARILRTVEDARIIDLYLLVKKLV